MLRKDPLLKRQRWWLKVSYTCFYLFNSLSLYLFNSLKVLVQLPKYTSQSTFGKCKLIPILAMLSAKDQNTPLQERAVEENVVAQKKIQSGRPRARRGRCKKKPEAPSSTPQVGRVHFSVTLKSFKLIWANFLWMVGYFAYPWGCMGFQFK